MSTTLYAPTTVTDMKAGFPTPPEHLTVIGTPTLHDLVQILIYLARCAQTHKSTISHNMNLLYVDVAMPPQVYAHYTQEAYPHGMYPFPPRPTDTPNFVGAHGATACENIKIQHALEVKRYIQNMNTALIDTFLDLMPMTSAYATQMQSSAT